MGRIVINQTDAKQVVILSSDDAAIQGGYYDANGEWHELGAEVNPVEFMAAGNPTGSIVIEAVEIASYAFAFRTGITSVTALNCETLGKNAFENCSGIVSTNFPALKAFNQGGYSFNGCTSLTEIHLPELTTDTPLRAFGGCSQLVTADLGKTTSILAQAFISTVALRNIVLRKTDGITNLSAWNANTLGSIYSHPAESTIYVPSALIDSYKAASNWSSGVTAGLTFAAIEGSEFEL